MSSLQRDRALRDRMSAAARDRALSRFDAATNARSLLDLVTRECQRVEARSRRAASR
jgi:hypothetical protein